MSKKQKLFHCTVTFTGVGSATIRDVTQEQAWAIQDVMRLIERQPPRYAESGVLLYSVRTETANNRQAITVRGGFLTRLMRRFNAWAMGGAALLLLAVLTPVAMTQDAGRTPNGVQSGMSGVRRTDKTVRALLGIQLKCLDDIARRRRAGDPAKAECPAFDAALKATPLSSLVRYDVSVKLSPADEEAFKYAILEAAYFGYQHASEKER